MRLTAVKESRPEVGSSRTRMEGSMTSSMPMVTRRRSPPEIPRMPLVPPTCDPATACKPSSSSTPSTRLCATFKKHLRHRVAREQHFRQRVAREESEEERLLLGYNLLWKLTR